MDDKIKQAITEVLINFRNLHDLSDSEIEGMSVLVSLLCSSDRDIRNIFYEEFGNIQKKVKEEYERRRQLILNTIPERNREEIDKQAKQMADKKLNKKNVVN